MKKTRSLAQNIFWVSLGVGAFLRYLWLSDIEYKGDEIYIFERVASSLGLAGTHSEPFSWIGMKSGVGPRNPGLSVWIFLALGHIFQVTNPVELARAVVTLNLTAFIAAHFFIQKVLPKVFEEKIQDLWYWALALAAVNPFFILYQRKLWAQSVLGVFSILFLWAWFRRDTKKGAFSWGFLGAVMGQIHMSGFIYSLSFVLYDRLFKKKSGSLSSSWFQGSLLGILPMLPWIKQTLNENAQSHASFHLPIFNPHYWIVWFSEPFGLHFGKIVGLKTGGPFYRQLESLWQFPLINDSHSQYASWIGFILNASVLLIALIFAVTILIKTIASVKASTIHFKIPKSQTLQAIGIASLLYGLLLTCAVQQVHRFYLLITFPLIFVCLTYLMNWAFEKYPWKFAPILITLLALETLTSFHFLAYIHSQGGALQGDYGISFSEQVKQGKLPASGLLPESRTNPLTGSTLLRK